MAGIENVRCGWQAIRSKKKIDVNSLTSLIANRGKRQSFGIDGGFRRECIMSPELMKEIKMRRVE